ncbi:hypothetical protein ABT112_10835 [Streptomyces sp. NPDC002055]|uniref:hypothetical protein n=1 Tax=Streptomyces sp. NPDC002055 TaxID=3154534 RepID=UPI00332D394F
MLSSGRIERDVDRDCAQVSFRKPAKKPDARLNNAELLLVPGKGTVGFPPATRFGATGVEFHRS